jgi:serine/threonine protein kinase
MRLFDFLKKNQKPSRQQLQQLPRRKVVPRPLVAVRLPHGSDSTEKSRFKIGDTIHVGFSEVGRGTDVVVRDIKAGGMGIVYIAQDSKTKDLLAVKTFHDWCLAVPGVVERFMREAETWIRLESHAHIVCANFVWQIERRPYIFIEYVNGSDLRAKLSSGRLPVPLALIYGIQFCRGMSYARSMVPGFVHRDIKPENCLITTKDVLKVTDFGLAKALAGVKTPTPSSTRDNQVDSHSFKTQMGESGVGTPAYMAPEQFEDLATTDMRADIYAFGGMLFEMLTGRRPFEAGSMEEWYQKHRHQPPPDPISFNREIPDHVADLILACLSKYPEKRPASFGEIERLLDCALAQGYDLAAGEMPLKESTNGDYLARAWSLMNIGSNHEALDFIDRALAITPFDKAALNIKGQVTLRLGNYNESFQCFDLIVKIDPSEKFDWINRATALKRLDRVEEALESVDRALVLDPQFAGAWIEKAKFLRILSRVEEASACEERALAIDPSNAVAWHEKGRHLLGAEKYEQALMCINKALELNPKNDQNWQADNAWVDKGAVLLSLSNFADAFDCFKRGLTINPENVDALVNIGTTYYEGYVGGPDFEEAEKWFAKASKLGDVQGWIKLGDTLNKLERHREALDSYKQAAILDPSNHLAFAKIGMMYEHGYGVPANLDRAIIHYRKAAALGNRTVQSMLANRGLA